MKLLISYFVLVQTFGLLFWGFDFFKVIENGEMIYLLCNFPVFALFYMYNIYGLSDILEKSNEEKYEKYFGLHPLRKSTNIVGPVKLFSKAILTDWKGFERKITLTKWNLIFVFGSFSCSALFMILRSA